MACSEARLAANRANALKSTGPKTDEGKEASRRNALTHGLTGGGVVIPGADADEVGRLAGPLVRELAPDGTTAACLLAERVATLIVRLRRSACHEFAATAERCRAAAADFDEARRAEAERLFGAIDEGTNRADLLTMPEGVDLLDATLGDLRALAVRAAGDPARWPRDASGRLARCLATEARVHAEALGRVLDDGDLAGIDRGLVAIMDPANVRGPWALDQVVGLVDAEREHLATVRAGLDLGAIARARDEAAHRALVGDAPEALRARRYEAATSRELYKALREIREIREVRRPPAPAEAPGPAPTPTPTELVQQADATHRQLARVEPAPDAAHVPPVGSFCPAVPGAPVAAHTSKLADPDPAPHGRSRYEDRRQRPRLGR